MDKKIFDAINFYAACNKLKDTIRMGHKVWNVKRKRIESVAEHIYGTQMLAIAIYHQFNYDLDLMKIITMLAVHEIEEIVIGDLAFFQITNEEKAIEGKKACVKILENIISKDKILSLIDEFNKRETKEAKFAYHCDKLECDLQVKLYDQEGCYDITSQDNNPIINNPIIKNLLSKEKTLSNAWIEYDRIKYEDDPNFLMIIDWLKNNNIG